MSQQPFACLLTLQEIAHAIANVASAVSAMLSRLDEQDTWKPQRTPLAVVDIDYM